MKYYKMAAEKGHVEANYILGEMYRWGITVRKDISLAKEYYEKACDRGHYEGCNMHDRLSIGGM